MAYQRCRQCDSDFSAALTVCPECSKYVEPTCPCGGVVQGWICQTCGADFVETADGEFVVAPGRLLAGVCGPTVFLWTEEPPEIPGTITGTCTFEPGASEKLMKMFAPPPYPVRSLAPGHVTTGGPAYGR